MAISDYLIDVPKPSENLFRGVQIASGINAVKTQQAELDAAATAQKTQEALSADLAALGDNPTPSAVASLSAKYPQLAEKFKASYDMLDSTQQKVKIESASKVYSATLAGRPDIAEQYLMEQSLAAENSGDEKEAKVLKDLAELVKMSPRTAQTIAGVMLSSAMGDEFIGTFTGLENSRRSDQLQGAAVKEADAKAHKAAIESQYAESNAVIDLEKKGWDIWKLQQDVDISRENARIAAMNAAAAKEGNALKRDELKQKIAAKKEERDQKVRDKAQMVQEFARGVDNSLSTIDRIIQSPGLRDVVGAVEGKEYYPNIAAGVSQTLNPFVSSADERANVIADIDTLQSQQFINQLKAVRAAAPSGASGMGNLTEKEGDRLINSLQSLRRDQGEEKFVKSLTEIQRLMLKARESFFDKYGIPQSVPDRPDMAKPTAEVPAGDVPLPSTGEFRVIGVE